MLTWLQLTLGGTDRHQRGHTDIGYPPAVQDP